MVARGTKSTEGIKVDISHRGEYIKETDDYEILGDYDYYYVIEGTNKENAVVTAL